MQHVRMSHTLYMHTRLSLSCYHACNMNAYMTWMHHQCRGNMHGTVGQNYLAPSCLLFRGSTVHAFIFVGF